MKGFKKLALVAAIAAPITSVHALEALDDSTLSGMTGQAGVTIELDTKVTMDSFTYTDEGSIVMETIAFGGAKVGSTSTESWNESDRLDEVQIDIDVTADGHLQIHLGSTDTESVLNGTDPLDFGLSVGKFGLSNAAGAQTAQTVIASDIKLAGVLGPQDIVIFNTGGSGLIKAQGYFEIKDGGMNIDVAGVGVSNLTIGQDDNPFADDTKLGGPATAGGGLLAPYSAIAAAKGYTDTSGANNWAFYAVTVGTTTSATGVTDALSFTVDSFNVDIAMDVGIGNGSSSNIGSIAMNNLDVSGTKMVVYGHD